MRDREVGIDLERVRLIKRAERIAARFLSPSDRAAVEAAAPGLDRADALLRRWVALEAMAKAWARGVRAVEEASSCLSTGQAGALHRATGSDGRIWSVMAVPAPDGYVTAVAAEGSDWHVRVAPICDQRGCRA